MIDKEELRRSIAANVTRLRLARGWTQEQLANKLNLHRPQISRLEKGEHSPSAELLYALADVFGVTADTLRVVCGEEFSHAPR